MARVLNFIEEALDEVALAVGAKSQSRLVFRLIWGITGVISRSATYPMSDQRRRPCLRSRLLDRHFQ
jgi:hypothetical protein